MFHRPNGSEAAISRHVKLENLSGEEFQKNLLLATRTIPVIDDLRLMLTAYRPEAGQHWLFPRRYRGHIHVDSAARFFKEACERVGIEGASTHSFRRTALTQMSNAGIPLRIIQEVSGHRNLEQLQRYLEVSPHQVRGAIASLSMLSPQATRGKYEKSVRKTEKKEEPDFSTFPHRGSDVTQAKRSLAEKIRRQLLEADNKEELAAVKTSHGSNQTNWVWHNLLTIAQKDKLRAIAQTEQLSLLAEAPSGELAQSAPTAGEEVAQSATAAPTADIWMAEENLQSMAQD